MTYPSMALKKENDIEWWQNSLLPPSTSVRDAVRNLNDVAIRISLIVNPDGVLLGTVSDGDVRRGLLRGLTLDDSVDKIMHTTPLVVPDTIERATVIELMQANKIHQIPILDKGNRVVGIHLWDQVPAAPKTNSVMIIMAGGKGTRLFPFTESCPKPMLKIGGKPMLEHIIERAIAEGFCRFVIAINYLGHIIEEYFGKGEKLNVDISYLREKTALGTAGALSLLREIPHDSFIVTNGDVITDIRYKDLLDFHTQHNAAATMAVRAHEWQHPFGVVQMQGLKIIGFEEKPVTRSYINAGVYALNPSALSMIKPHEICDMPTLYENLYQQGNLVIAYPMHEPWLDIGRPDDLAKANNIH